MKSVALQIHVSAVAFNNSMANPKGPATGAMIIFLIILVIKEIISEHLLHSRDDPWCFTDFHNLIIKEVSCYSHVNTKEQGG